MTRRNQRIGRGALVGLAAGLVGSWAMNQFQALWLKASQELQSKQQQEQGQENSGSQTESEDATMKAADKLSRTFLRRPLSQDEKKTAGPIVHYAFGSAMGVLYGVGAELFPEISTRGFGTGFGTALFVAADEIGVPALGLSGNPAEVPLSSHFYALVSHLIYGATTEGVRRIATAAL